MAGKKAMNIATKTRSRTEKSIRNSKLIKKKKEVRPILHKEEAPIKENINFDELNFDLREVPKGKSCPYDLQVTIRIDAHHSIHEINTGYYFKNNKIDIWTIAISAGKIEGKAVLLLFVNPKSRKIRPGAMIVNRSKPETYRVNRKALAEKIFQFFDIQTIPEKLDDMVKLWLNVVPIDTGTKEMVFALKHFKIISNIRKKRKIHNEAVLRPKRGSLVVGRIL